ncbi:hypothetical protein ACFO3D_13790 [Virgibacillus kekensis]|uniref:Uncharacterized protein n=1 Tax=Virgibacillus kekensis TaxID=202261 RepID=A0ABV9DM78_9BACI
MGKNLNISSFIASFICILLFFLLTFVNGIRNLFFELAGFHPLYMVLVFSVLTFFTGLAGCAGIDGWKAMGRSIVTVVLTLGLSLFTLFVLLMGNLLNLT